VESVRIVLFKGFAASLYVCADMPAPVPACFLQTSQERTQAEQALRPFGQSTEYVPHCKVCNPQQLHQQWQHQQKQQQHQQQQHPQGDWIACTVAPGKCRSHARLWVTLQGANPAATAASSSSSQSACAAAANSSDQLSRAAARQQ
jgi:hypothetical protein